MKRKVIFLTAVFLLTIVATTFSQKQATISFSKATHDFGNIKEDGGKVSYSFKFINTGNAPLVVQDVKASCGCTTPSWTKTPIKPGKVGKIKVTFNPMGRPYSFSKSITVKSNASNAVEVITIKGNVLKKEK